MAHLLGSEICIESLIKDITDIQNTVSEISSKTGKVCYIHFIINNFFKSIVY